MDLLFPNVGEICGGSVREHLYDRMQNRIEEINHEDTLQW